MMRVKLNKLKLWEDNPRGIEKKDFETLKRRLAEKGQFKPLLINQDNIVLGGNMRLRAMRDLGWEEASVVRVTTKNKEEMVWYALVDNEKSGYYEGEKLAELALDLPELEDIKVDLGKSVELKDLLDKYRPEKEFGGIPIKDFKDIKILNLYAGIGGNRKLWGDLNVTAVEYNEEIAKVYRDYFPNDEVIIGDAHDYLEKNFDKYDFIWSSPPCPTHSLLRKGLSMAAGAKPKYPDMKLYEEILFLQGYYEGKWVVENVRSWYDPLIEPQERGRHYYWTNFDIPESDIFNHIREVGTPEDYNFNESSKKYGFNLDKYKFSSHYPKDKILRNMVHPKVGKYILECAYNINRK